MTCNHNCRQGRDCNCAGWHIVPLNDLRKHQENGSCFCKPTLDDGVWLHHSMDGREAFETGERQPS
jgi:hypothetical protein